MPNAAQIDWASVGVSDVGTVRKINEDAFLDYPEHAIWAVADGMGGHHAGDFASSAIVQDLKNMDHPQALEEAVASTMKTLATTNNLLCDQAVLRQVELIGSTVAVFIARGARASCLWAGDCRVYRMRGGELCQLTEDHSRVQELVAAGLISREEARTHPDSNIVTRALGVSEEVKLDTVEVAIDINDTFLICSDGLPGEITDREIQSILDDQNYRQAAEKLLRLALDRGARDNVTLVVIRAFADDMTQISPAADRMGESTRTIISDN